MVESEKRYPRRNPLGGKFPPRLSLTISGFLCMSAIFLNVFLTGFFVWLSGRGSFFSYVFGNLKSMFVLSLLFASCISLYFGFWREQRTKRTYLITASLFQFLIVVLRLPSFIEVFSYATHRFIFALTFLVVIMFIISLYFSARASYHFISAHMRYLDAKLKNERSSIPSTISPTAAGSTPGAPPATSYNVGFKDESKEPSTGSDSDNATVETYGEHATSERSKNGKYFLLISGISGIVGFFIPFINSRFISLTAFSVLTLWGMGWLALIVFIVSIVATVFGIKGKRVFEMAVAQMLSFGCLLSFTYSDIVKNALSFARSEGLWTRYSVFYISPGFLVFSFCTFFAFIAVVAESAKERHFKAFGIVLGQDSKENDFPKDVQATWSSSSEKVEEDYSEVNSCSKGSPSSFVRELRNNETVKRMEDATSRIVRKTAARARDGIDAYLEKKERNNGNHE